MKELGLDHRCTPGLGTPLGCTGWAAVSVGKIVEIVRHVINF